MMEKAVRLVAKAVWLVLLATLIAALLLCGLLIVVGVAPLLATVFLDDLLCAHWRAYGREAHHLAWAKAAKMRANPQSRGQEGGEQ